MKKKKPDKSVPQQAQKRANETNALQMKGGDARLLSRGV
jgi:hypothetical protein